VHIIVCAKQIQNPEIATSVFRVDEQTNKVIPVAGMPLVMSPFDEQCMEAALRIREKLGEVKITIMSLGAKSTKDVIKHGLSMGADEGVILDEEGLDGGDSYTTALMLAEAIKKVGAYDLILTGRQAADWDAGIVGPGLSELLGIPAITFARSVQVEGSTVRVERVLEDGFETVEAALPAIVTISNELGEARKPNLRETMKAARKPTKAMTTNDLGLDASKLGAAGARTVLDKLYIPLKDGKCELIQGGSAQELAANLVRKLQEAKLI
jgi:electron transfer flavoprotein beta subunit